MGTENLPDDWQQATLLGRCNGDQGPILIMLKSGRVYDVSKAAPTMSALLSECELSELPSTSCVDKGPVEEVLEFGLSMLSPVDLQCIKAAGVTFAVSAIERVIEERARGDADKALEIRKGLAERVGNDIAAVRPGTEEAAALKNALIADGLWSQYLEVAIGPDAEVFTKAPILSSVGHGQQVGIRRDSDWNNPEPEIVVVCNNKGEPVGATLGNDVNLRDFEGRSALLLGKAKDNNASCAMGPFIRVFDHNFSMDDVRSAVVEMEVRGEDGFVMRGQNRMSQISRDPMDLIGQTFSDHHAYPDGFALFLGTLFAPTQDRDDVGRGFTHKRHDMVRVTTPKLGGLENEVVFCDEAPRWTFGVLDLMRNLNERGLL